LAIKLDNNNIYVSVPLKNSEFQYKVKFNNYLSAIKYTEDKFNYFNDSDTVNYNNINNNYL
jgi:hemolysin activation/secretion protein